MNNRKAGKPRAEEYSLYGFTDMPSVHSRGTVVLTHGEGPNVVDVHGRRYLDANSGLWNMVAGFDHKGLIEAAQAQYARFPGYHSFFGRMSDQTVMLSDHEEVGQPEAVHACDDLLGGTPVAGHVEDGAAGGGGVCDECRNGSGDHPGNANHFRMLQTVKSGTKQVCLRNKTS